MNVLGKLTRNDNGLQWEPMAKGGEKEMSENMDFKLKVGDVVRTTSDDYSVFKITKTYIYLGEFNKYPVAMIVQWLSAPGVSFHRPTPEGLVQVWPEVVE